jgi:hypothetical protein
MAAAMLPLVPLLLPTLGFAAPLALLALVAASGLATTILWHSQVGCYLAAAGATSSARQVPWAWRTRAWLIGLA